MITTIDKGVNLKGLHPEAFHAWNTACTVGLGLGVTQLSLRLTSAVREKGKKSFHPMGYAIDIKYENLPRSTSMRDIVSRLKLALGDQYDVVYHKDSDGVGKHIHIEFDPR